MGVFTYIRENKYFFNALVFVLLVAVLFSNAGGTIKFLYDFYNQPQLYVGVINGHKIYKGEYAYFFNEKKRRILSERGADYPYADLPAHKGAWEILITKYAYKRGDLGGLTVPNEEARALVRGEERLHPENKERVNQITAWRNYISKLAKNNPKQLEFILMNVTAQRLREKILFLLEKSLSLMTLGNPYKKKIDIAYFKLPDSYLEKKFSKESLSKDEISAFYEKNKEQYKSDKKVVLSWLQFDSVASQEDRDTIRAELKQVIEVLKKTKSETEKLRVAMNYLGTNEPADCQVSLKKEKLPLLMKEALKRNQPIIGPVLTDRESYAIYIPTYTGPKAKFQGIQNFIKIEKNILPSPHTIRKTLQEAKEKAKKSWSHLVLTHKKMIQEFSINREQVKRMLGYKKMFKKPAQWAFSSKIKTGDISDPMEIKEGSYVICHVEKIISPTVKSLKMVEPEIRRLLENQLYKRCMEKEIEKMGIQEMSLQKFKKLASQYHSSVHIKRGLSFDISQKIRGVKKAYKMIGAAFGLKMKGFTITSDGRSIFMVTRIPSKVTEKQVTELDFASLRKADHKKKKKNRRELRVALDLLIKKLAKITDERFLFY